MDGSQCRTSLWVCCPDILSRVLPTARLGKYTNSPYLLVEGEAVAANASSLENSIGDGYYSSDGVEEGHEDGTHGFASAVGGKIARPAIWFLGRGLFSSSEHICSAYGATFATIVCDWQPENVVVRVWRVTTNRDGRLWMT